MRREDLVVGEHYFLLVEPEYARGFNIRIVRFEEDGNLLKFKIEMDSFSPPTYLYESHMPLLFKKLHELFEYLSVAGIVGPMTCEKNDVNSDLEEVKK